MSRGDDDDFVPPRPRKPRPAPGKKGPGERGPSSFQPARNNPGDRVYTDKPGLFERVFLGSVSLAHLSAFCRQLATLQGAGVGVLESLGTLRKSFAKTALGPIIGRVQLAVRQGDSLAEAMAREPQAFDTFFVSLMRVAEARGHVPEVLRRLSLHYEARLRLVRQARSALIYPVSVLVIAAAVVWLLSSFVLPGFLEMLQDKSGHHAGLPTPTRLLMAFSSFMKGLGWWLMPLAAVGGVFLIARVYQTAGGKAVLDRLLLRVPVLGALLRKIDITRFAETLGTLLDSGVGYDKSLALTADVLRMAPLKSMVHDVRKQVAGGQVLSTALAAHRQFDDEVVTILENGEETGQLPESLAKLSEIYEEQVEYTVKNLGSLLQPLLMLFLGGIVLFIALAFFLAYVSVINDLVKG